MLRIRLSRVGKKGRPSYRIVVADVAAPRDGAYLEWIGNYDPLVDPPAITLKQDRARHWLNLGAQPSAPVQRILDKNGVARGVAPPGAPELVDAAAGNESDEMSAPEAAEET